MEKIIEEGLQSIIPFLGSLEWTYIISFIILCYTWQSLVPVNDWKILKKIKKRYQVALLGILYAPIHYLIWDLERDQIGALFSSFLVSFAFHKLLVDVIIGAIKQKISLFALEKMKGGKDE